jgi:hypothetical protein
VTSPYRTVADNRCNLRSPLRVPAQHYERSLTPRNAWDRGTWDVGLQPNRSGLKGLKTYSNSKHSVGRASLEGKQKKRKNLPQFRQSRVTVSVLLTLTHPSTRQLFQAASCQLLRFPHHAVQLAHISAVVTVHLLDEVKPHCLIYLHIRKVSRTF